MGLTAVLDVIRFSGGIGSKVLTLKTYLFKKFVVPFDLVWVKIL